MSGSTTNDTLVYSSDTINGGVEHMPVVEHVANKTLRVNDTGYGLKTAAKVVRTKVERETFLAQKAEAIAKQRNREAEKKAVRVADLDKQIARLYQALITETASDMKKTLALYDTLVAKRASLV